MTSRLIRKVKEIKKVVSKNKEKNGGKILFAAPRGMHDILPMEQPWWEKIRKVFQETAVFYNFLRIDTPILENAEIFEKGVGGMTDIVEKQMFILRQKGKDRLALRPEGTAGIIRSYLQHNLNRLAQPLRLYYLGPMFRYENPQAGRYRQFYQLGFEILGGEDDPLYDAQIILASFRVIEELKIKNFFIKINSLGCKNCRSAYRRKLQEYYRKLNSKICKDCQRRSISNPLRLLDCKNERCQTLKEEAPAILDHLCNSCRSHFRGVLEYLDELNLPYLLDNHLVRGLDYYNRTVFELVIENDKIALGGGGRYDSLGDIIGNRKSILPAVGSSLGVERVIEEIKKQGVNYPASVKPKIFLIQIGKPAKKKSISLIERFREAGIRVGEALGRESLKSQLKIADREGAVLALILGQKEVFEDSIIVRDMKSGVQENVPLGKIIEDIKKKLK